MLWETAGTTSMAPSTACQSGLTLRSICVTAPQPPLVAVRQANSTSMAPTAARQPALRLTVKKMPPRMSALNMADFQFQRRMNSSTGCAQAQRRTGSSGTPSGGTGRGAEVMMGSPAAVSHIPSQ